MWPAWWFFPNIPSCLHKLSSKASLWVLLDFVCMLWIGGPGSRFKFIVLCARHMSFRTTASNLTRSGNELVLREISQDVSGACRCALEMWFGHHHDNLEFLRTPSDVWRCADYSSVTGWIINERRHSWPSHAMVNVHLWLQDVSASVRASTRDSLRAQMGQCRRLGSWLHIEQVSRAERIGGEWSPEQGEGRDTSMIKSFLEYSTNSDLPMSHFGSGREWADLFSHAYKHSACCTLWSLEQPFVLWYQSFALLNHLVIPSSGQTPLVFPFASRKLSAGLSFNTGSVQLPATMQCPR